MHIGIRLAIELDGETHADQAAYDAKRTEALAKFGIQVVRYTNTEVINNPDGVYEDLQRRVLALKNPPRPSLIREGVPDKGDLGGLKSSNPPRHAVAGRGCEIRPFDRLFSGMPG